jgi:hypothetical protein
MNHLLEFCKTDRQREIIQAFIDVGTKRGAAKKLGIDSKAVRECVQRVENYSALHGVAPECHLNKRTPDIFPVSGTSTAYNQDGDVVLQWVKTSVDKQKQLEVMKEVVAALSEDIKPVSITKIKEKKTNPELCNLFVVTDLHFGAYAWAEETGADWDLEIAEKTLINWFKDAISRSPNSETAVLAQLGDLGHFDGMEAVTPTSNHVLDADSRFQKVIRVIIRTFRQIITMLLQKHKRVHLIMAEGNHDLAGSAWLREMFNALYENEPRLNVETSPNPYYCYEHGKTSLFFHHGHKRKPSQVTEVFAAQFRDVFGKTDHSFAHMGHLHNDLVLENNLMKVEQHRTLAAPDAYAARGGWKSGRDAKVITYSKKHGEVSRLIISSESVM